MANNTNNFKRFINGLILPRIDSGPQTYTETGIDKEGAVWNFNNKFRAFLDSAVRELITHDQTQTLTNKTIGDTNTINAQDDAFAIQDAADATLEIEFNAAGTTGTKTTITSSQTSDKVVTLPDATDTLVGQATTDTLTNKTIDADGTGNSITNLEDANIKAGAGIDAAKLADGTVSNDELQYINSLSSNAQDQIDDKATDSTVVHNTGNENVGGVKTFTDTTQSTSKDDGGVVMEGGLGVEKNLNVGGNQVIEGDLTVQGTTTTLNTDTLDVEDANITVNKNGNQASANSADAGITVEMSDATDAKVGYDSSKASKFIMGEVGSEEEVATVGHAQTLTNKSLSDSTTSFVDEGDATKELDVSLGGATTSTKTTIVSSQTINRNITLPDATTTLVGTATSDVLTNKDIDGATASNTNRITIPKDTKSNLDALTRKEGTIVYASDENKLYADNGSALVELAAGGGGGGGGGLSYTDALMGEATHEDNAAVYRHELKYLVVDSTNKYIDFDEGGSELTATLTEGSYLISDLGDGTSFDLLVELKTQLEAVGGLTYSPTYSTSTRKITLVSSSNATYRWKTGSVHGSDNADTHAGTLLGFDDSANDTGSTSYEADSAIDDSLTKLCAHMKCDSSLYYKSRSFAGFITSATAKGANGTCSQGEVTGYTDLTPAKEYYTRSSIITIDSTNNKLDFDEGSGEINSTITSGEYLYPYDDLNAELKSQMDTDGTDTYTWTYNQDTEKFNCSSSGTCSLDFLTGTNNATSIDITIGFDHADQTTAASHTSDNSLVLKGGRAYLPNEINSNSQLIGASIDSTKLFSNISMTDIIPVVNSPNDFLNTPIEKDYTEEIQFHDMHINAEGVGCRVVQTIPSPSIYKFQYTSNGGGTWADSTTTVTFGVTSSFAGVENFSGNYHYRSRVFTDENGIMVAALSRLGGTLDQYSIFAYCSYDGGDTWVEEATLRLTNGASGDFHIGGIYVRANKAVILSNRENNAQSEILISNLSAGKYDTWSTAIAITNDYYHTYPSGVLIAYNGDWTGDDKYKIITFGTRVSGARFYVATFDGAGTNEEIDVPIAVDSKVIYNACLDSAGSGNRVLFGIRTDGASAALNVVTSNDVEGSITFTDHGDINSGGSNIDSYNGYSSASNKHTFWNLERRCMMYGDYIYILAQTNANAGSKVELGLFYSTNGGTTLETKVDIGGDQNNQECCLHYMAGPHGFLVCYKYSPTAATTNNLTNGQIFARYFEINPDGSYSAYDAVQVDGGESESGFQGFLTVAGSVDAVSINFEHYNGSTRDVLWHNVFI